MRFRNYRNKEPIEIQTLNNYMHNMYMYHIFESNKARYFIESIQKKYTI